MELIILTISFILFVAVFYLVSQFVLGGGRFAELAYVWLGGFFVVFTTCCIVLVITSGVSVA